MGYRSDVAYTIRFNHDDERVATQSFYTFLAEAKSKPEYAFAFKEVEINEKKREINFLDVSTKWYDSYPEVQSHAALVKLADEWCNAPFDSTACAYVFMRMGEDDDDVEHRTGGNYGLDWINLERRLVTDWS